LHDLGDGTLVNWSVLRLHSEEHIIERVTFELAGYCLRDVGGKAALTDPGPDALGRDSRNRDRMLLSTSGNAHEIYPTPSRILSVERRTPTITGLLAGGDEENRTLNPRLAKSTRGNFAASDS
jgi:hypothetical protein